MATGTPAHEFRELTDAELNDRLSAAKEELFNLRFQLATGQLTNNRRIPAVKRDIARIYTRCCVSASSVCPPSLVKELTNV